jgi:hypothetical protein
MLKLILPQIVYFNAISAIECGKTCKQKEGKPFKGYQQVGEDQEYLICVLRIITFSFSGIHGRVSMIDEYCQCI